MEVAERHFFPKSNRLFLRNDIIQLFEKGQSFIIFPLRVVYLPKQGLNFAISALTSVSKRNFKHAVARNHIKRLMRESFRLNKHILTERIQAKTDLHIAFIYISDKSKSYSEIEKAMRKALKQIVQREET